jgi:hypothetical protein
MTVEQFDRGYWYATDLQELAFKELDVPKDYRSWARHHASPATAQPRLGSRRRR